ncbi:MAG TPA: hypothetical protein PKN36_04635 [bacterium]|nr:hypothetical protein [bacterium]
MKKIMLLLSAVSVMACIFRPAEARILIGDNICIEKPSFEEILTIGDEIQIKSSLGEEFAGIGRIITADTDIDRDFIGVGMKIDFRGTSKGDVVLIGNNIKAEGKIAGSMTAFGKNIRIKTFVENNLRASAENIEIEADVKGKTTLWGKDIFIGGRYNDIVIYGNNVIFREDTVIEGDLTYSTPVKKDLALLNVKGNVIWNKPFTERIKEKTPIEKLKKLYLFFSLLFPVLIMLGFFPNLFKQTTYISGHSFIKCFISGLMLIIPILIAIPIIFITIIGAPLGLIVTSLFLSLIYVSRVFPAIFIGRTIFFKFKDSTPIWVLSTFAGIFLFTAVSIHPTAKILLNLIFIPAGFGALFMGRISLIKRLKKEGVL